MAIPTDGLVFYAPLAEDKATAETGQTMNYTGNSIVFENYKGKNSFQLDGTASNYISATLGSLEGDFTISFFCIERERKTFAQLGYYGSYFAFYVGNIALADSSHNLQTDKGATVDTWYFYSISRSGNTYIFYRNYDILFYGEDSGGGFSFSGNLVLGKCFSYAGGWQEFFGNIAAFRIYSRALNISEIYSLANEFNEDSGGSDSGNTGFLIDGLFLSSSKPKLGQKGLLLDNKYFLPLVQSGYLQAGVIVDVDGVTKVQPLSFQGQAASDSGTAQEFTAKIFNTGKDQPDYGGSTGGSADYYRCASVDTETHTWTGYKAVLDSGFYTFETSVTQNLQYTSVKPEVGNVYSSDALVTVFKLNIDIPQDGLVFFAPLDKKYTEAMGYALEYNGKPSFVTQSGVPCFYSNDTTWVRAQTINPFRQAYNAGTFAISMWCQYQSGSQRAFLVFVGAGSDYMQVLPFSMGATRVTQLDTDIWLDQNKQGMRHIVVTAQNYSLSVYVNNVKVVSDYTMSVPTIPQNTNAFTIGRLPRGWGWSSSQVGEISVGYTGCIRAYNRNLTAEQVNNLFIEFGAVNT